MKEQQDEVESQSNSQQTLTHLLQPQRKYSSQHPKQILVTDAVVDFVADDLIPLSVVESKQFKSLLRILDSQYQVPSHKQLSTVLLKKKYNKLKSSVLDKLKKTDTINLTIDLWSIDKCDLIWALLGTIFQMTGTLSQLCLHAI